MEHFLFIFNYTIFIIDSSNEYFQQFIESMNTQE